VAQFGSIFCCGAITKWIFASDWSGWGIPLSVLSVHHNHFQEGHRFVHFILWFEAEVLWAFVIKFPTCKCAIWAEMIFLTRHKLIDQILSAMLSRRKGQCLVVSFGLQIETIAVCAMAHRSL
jgi:hypothetical protein